MKRTYFNVVTDGSWGSCGKGLITTALAHRHRPEIISTTNMSNAGHTAVYNDGSKFIAKALPSATALHKWMDNYKPFIMVGATAAFQLEQLLHEIEFCGVQNHIAIHPRAGVITEEQKQRESGVTGTKHIASTMQGCGTFLADKIMRRADLKLANDYPELANYLVKHLPQKLNNATALNQSSMAMMLYQLMRLCDYTVLHEGSQGFSLDISHGSHYPQCTSRSTTAVQNLADMGVPASLLGDVYLVIRPYPIRVGNVIEEGQTVGYSGDCYDDQHEISWKDVSTAANAPPEVTNGELTTVTKRLRRVFSWSDKQFLEAVTINGATKIALNFANYIDWSCYGMNNYSALPMKVLNFINRIEDLSGIPVTIVGTGPQNDHVCFLDR